MSMGAEVDAEVDLGPLVLESIVGLKASFDSVAKELKKAREVEDAYQFGAVEVPLSGSAMSEATGNLVISLGGPSYGRLWQLRRLSVGGGLWTDTVAGQALIVVTSSTSSGTPPLTDIADQAATLPNIATYSTRQVVLRHPNRLFVVFVAPTATTQYAVGGAVTDYPDRRVRLTTED